MKIVLLSTYEMGHQPLSLAWPLAALQEAGLDARACDLSVQDFPEEAVRSARIVAISVPMLTALRLGVETARRVRRLNPGAHLCFYGLYAHLNAEYLRNADLADSILAGEIEPALVRLATSIGRPEADQSSLQVARMQYPVPQRAGLPGLEAYAQLQEGSARRLAGYTESTRGCLHMCSHCPVVPVYEGRFFAVPVDIVLEDVRRQVALGATHITFGDPDFLNGPTHARRVARAVHTAIPDLTFDFTAKVEHLLAHADLLPELVAHGARFVVSAFESTSDEVLDRLAKGHRAADLEQALGVCRTAGLTLQPTWVAFTPWTRLEDYLGMLAWVRSQGMIADVPAVQFTVRLLVPPHSKLLETDFGRNFGSLDPENFTHTWAHPDPRMDELHLLVKGIVESACGCEPIETFRQVESAAYRLAGATLPVWAGKEMIPAAGPRLTEDWFC